MFLFCSSSVLVTQQLQLSFNAAKWKRNKRTHFICCFLFTLFEFDFCLFRKIILTFFLFQLLEIEGTNCNRTRWKKTLRPKCFCKKCSQKMAQDAWRQQHHNGAITTSITYLCIWVEGLIRQNQGNNLVFHHIIWRFQIVAGYRRMH